MFMYGIVSTLLEILVELAETLTRQQYGDIGFNPSRDSGPPQGAGAGGGPATVSTLLEILAGQLTTVSGDGGRTMFQPFLRFWCVTIFIAPRGLRPKGFQPFLRFWGAIRRGAQDTRAVVASTLLEILENPYTYGDKTNIIICFNPS